MAKTGANSLTESVLKALNYSGKYVAWRNNNGAVYDVKKAVFRKNPIHKLGVPDILAFRKADAVFVGIEVKYGKDKLSQEQTIFLSDLKKSGGIAIECRSIDDIMYLIK